MTAITLVGVGAVAAWIAGYGISGVVMRYALDNAILDRPNERSMHTVATPRGGGIAIVLPVLAAIGLGSALGLLGTGTAIGLGLGCAIVAVTGWVDDRGGLRPITRLCIQIGAAVLLVATLGWPSVLRLGPWAVELGAAGVIVSVLFVVWCTNLYNFMDGIDGFAGSQGALIFGIGGALLLLSDATGLAFVCAAAAAASLGFLHWNWPPAKLFMGDVGSGTLGFLLAGVALAGDGAGNAPAMSWVLLLGVFVFDATVTLFRRVANGERAFSAHRSHAYQRLVQGGWTHRGVSLAAAVATLVVGALSAASWSVPERQPLAVALGVGILAVTFLWVERIRPYVPPRPPSGAAPPRT